MRSELPTKEVDVDFLVFVERYATDLLKWDLLTFFGHNPDFCDSSAQIAQHLGRNDAVIRPELGDLALLGILDKTQASGGKILYALTKEPHLKNLTLKFANSQLAVRRPGSDALGF
jgi:hypothetical protein